jgi:hypothetical protein
VVVEDECCELVDTGEVGEMRAWALGWTKGIGVGACMLCGLFGDNEVAPVCEGASDTTLPVELWDVCELIGGR